MNSDANWAQAAQQMQETFTKGLQQAMGSFGSANPFGAAGAPAGFPQMDLSAFKSLQQTPRTCWRRDARWMTRSS